MKKTKLLLTLFFSMLKIGLFTFGGGYAMIALLENEFVEKRKWIDKDDFLNMTAIAESTPGPIAINSSTYIGYKKCGIAGALVSTVGVCIPSFVIIYVISLFFDRFMSFEYVKYAFCGIEVCVSFLIIRAGIKFLLSMKKSVFNLIVFGTVLLLMILFSLFAIEFSSIYYILASGALGVIAFLFSFIKEKNEERK